MSFHDASRGPSAIAELLVTVDGRRTARDGCTTQGPLFRHRTLCRAAPLISTSSPRFAAVRSALCFGISSSVSHCSLSLSPSFLLLLRVCLSVEPCSVSSRPIGRLARQLDMLSARHARTHARADPRSGRTRRFSHDHDDAIITLFSRRDYLRPCGARAAPADTASSR